MVRSQMRLNVALAIFMFIKFTQFGLLVDKKLIGSQ